MEYVDQVISKVQNTTVYQKVKANETYNKVAEPYLAIIYQYLTVLVLQLKAFYTQLLQPLLNGTKTYKEQLDLVCTTATTQYNIYTEKFKNQFLNGKEALLSAAFEQATQAKKSSKLVWVDFGAGEGNNLELMAQKSKDGVLKNNFSKIYLVETSSSLCNKARERVTKLGLGDLVEVVEQDVSNFEIDNKANLVTFSYTLTTLPNWIEAIENVNNNILADDGVVASVDFYTSRKFSKEGTRQHNLFTRIFWQLVFSLGFNIFVNADHLPYLESRFESTLVEENMGKIPVVSFVTLGRLLVPYYLFVGTKSQN